MTVQENGQRNKVIQTGKEEVQTAPSGSSIRMNHTIMCAGIKEFVMNKTYEISCFCSKTNTDSVAVVKSVSVKNAIRLLDRKIFPTINSILFDLPGEEMK